MNTVLYVGTMFIVYTLCEKYWPGPKWRAWVLGILTSMIVAGGIGYYQGRTQGSDCIKNAECALKEVTKFSPAFGAMMKADPALEKEFVTYFNAEAAKPNPNYYQIGLGFFAKYVQPVLRQASAPYLFPMMKQEEKFVQSVCTNDIDWANGYFLGTSADITKLSPESKAEYEKFITMKSDAYMEGKNRPAYVPPSKKEGERLAMEVFVNNPKVTFTAEELNSMDMKDKSPAQNCITMRKLYKAMVSIQPDDAVAYYKAVVLE